jgi:sugar transferase (PEP-CTERM/EpsH1 system associated)
MVAKLRDLGAAEVEVATPFLDRRRRKLTSLVGLLTGEALTLPFFRHRELRRAVDGWLAARGPDVVHVYSSSMAQYVLPGKTGSGSRGGEGGTTGARAEPLRLMQFAELDSDKWRQYALSSRNPLTAWLYRREARRLLAFEAEVARRFDVSFVCSPVEKELFVERIPDAKAPVVLPNGVDVEHFTSAGDAERDPHTLIFTGVMDYEPNVDGVLWFVRSCWPAVRAALPDARLLVVGNRPTQEIRALDSIDGIVVTGWVETTPPWFDRAAVAIAPLRLARGVQNKVLEAMAMGLPVVSTPQAAQGIERPGGASDEPVLIEASDAETTTRAVLELLRDPEEAKELGARAAAFVRSHYRWESMFARLDAVLRDGGPSADR